MSFNFNFQINTTESIFYLIISAIVLLCVFTILVAVLIDFAEFQKRERAKKEKKSIVETGTMLLFFGFFYFFIRFGIGQIQLNLGIIKILSMTVGSLILVVGCMVNILGRMNLGKNWSNQIKIYADHAFVSGGAYRFVRHPLYASIIWMFCGASLVYVNYLALLANIIIFIPFMYFRARQEEEMLAKEFVGYKNYQKKVGMFFPKLFLKK
jgi:protein-S-isoprenylcysteine O-methyltransferase Ste14